MTGIRVEGIKEGLACEDHINTFNISRTVLNRIWRNANAFETSDDKLALPRIFLTKITPEKKQYELGSKGYNCSDRNKPTFIQHCTRSRRQLPAQSPVLLATVSADSGGPHLGEGAS